MSIGNLQKIVLSSLRNISDSSYFYIKGGTALAKFYLGHRRSYDLDIFTAQKGLILPFSRTVEEELKKTSYLSFYLFTSRHS